MQHLARRAPRHVLIIVIISVPVSNMGYLRLLRCVAFVAASLLFVGQVGASANWRRLFGTLQKTPSGAYPSPPLPPIRATAAAGEPAEKVCLGQCSHGERPYGQRERVGRCTPRLRIKQLLASCSLGRVMISLHPDSCNGFTHQYSHLLHPHLRACLFGAGLPPLRQVPPPSKAAPLEQPQGSPPPPLRLPPSAAAATGTASSGTGRTSQLWGSDGELWTAGGRLNDFSYAG